MSSDPRVDPRLVAPQHQEQVAVEPSDPLRLCVFATVALVAWLLGPAAVLFFAVLGLVGYARARRAGLLRSRCKLGDTRWVMAYLAVIALIAAAAVGVWLQRLGGS